MRRWHQDISVMLRRRRVCQWIGREMPLGEMRKRHPLDCGSPRCGLCHPSKRWHAKERRAADKRTIGEELTA